MRKTSLAKLITLSASLCLPGLAAAQFPYSAWTCERAYKLCSPALLPAEGQSIAWGEPPQGPEYTWPRPEFNQEKLSRFSKAFAEIKKISRQFTSDMPEDATAEDTKRLRDQAHSKALQALQSANISRQEYNEVAVYMNRHMGLRAQVIGSPS